MLFITDKLIGEIVCGAFLGLLVILILCAIFTSTSKKKKNDVKSTDNEAVENNTTAEEEKEDVVVAEEAEEESTEEEDAPAEEKEEESTEEEDAPVEEEEESTEEEDAPVEEAEEENTEEEDAPAEEEEEESTEEEDAPVEEEEEESTEEEDAPVEEAEEESTEEEDAPAEEAEEESTEEEDTPAEDAEEESTEEEKTSTDEASVQQQNARYAGKYVITIDETGYRFKLVASNGQSLIVSEAYTTEAGCRRGIDTIKRNVAAGQVKIDRDKHNLYFFTLVSKQNRILAQSASYKAKDSVTRASESFKKFALTDNIVVDEESKKASNAEVVNIESEVKDGGEYTFEQDSHGYIYVLKASNGVKIVTSQDYSSLSAAKDAYERFKDAVYNGEWQIVKDKNSNYQFKLYLRRRLVVAGELYQSKDQVKSTIASIKSWAKNATYEEPKFEENQE